MGADARTFLQSQLTQDVMQVSKAKSALTGFCTAQGRLWATLLMAQGQSEDALLGVFSKDLQDSLLKRLKMFVLRSKVTLELAPASVYGIYVPVQRLDNLAAQLGYEMPTEVWASTTSADQAHLIRLPCASDAYARYLIIAQEDWAAAAIARCEGNLVVSPDCDQWRLLDIEAGLPWIEAKTQDMFIPQTVNLDLIAGVSFTKGCYPGQEVVARAHYRGTVKRRMHAGKASNVPFTIESGMDIAHADDPGSPVGRVINAVTVTSADGDGTHVLFEAPFASVEQSGLVICTPQGTVALTEDTLPYPLQSQSI